VYERASWAIALLSLVGALVGLALLREPRDVGALARVQPAAVAD
jgi:hypothetical protein